MGASQHADRTAGLNAALYYETRTLCPVCNELVPGRVVPRKNQVFIERVCPKHGAFEGLICSDREWYERLPLFFTEGVKPRSPRPGPRKGCPEDCGLCAAHSQIAGTAAIEISNVCNGTCPTCLANNQGTFELSVKDVEEAVNAVLRNQDQIDTVTLSGGEPTIHPQLFDILRALRRPEVGRVAINSNGIRIAEDEEFVKRLAQQDNIYVSLHFDGQRARELRGIDPAVQRRAADRLNRYGIAMAPVILAAKGINDMELGAIVEDLLFSYPSVIAIIISIMAYTGERGTSFTGDPKTRLTIPEALDDMETTTQGRIRKYDFMPLPMPNPMCAAIGYFWRMDRTLTPLIPYGEIEQVVAHTKNGHFGKLTPEFGQFLSEAVNSLYAHPEKYPNAEALLKNFKKLYTMLFPPGQPIGRADQLKVAAEHMRIIYLMQFMDAWTFDSRRLSRCSCQHMLPGGKIVSSCGYYTYHRRFDPRFQQKDVTART